MARRDNDSTVISVYMRTEQYKQLVEYAKLNRMSVAKVIRIALEDSEIITAIKMWEAERI